MLYSTSQRSLIHIYNHTLVAEVTLQGDNLLIKSDGHSHTQTHTNGRATKCQLGFSVLFKDTSTCSQESNHRPYNVMLLTLLTFPLPSAGYIQSWRWQADGHLPGVRGANASCCRPDFPTLSPRALLPQESHPPATLAWPHRLLQLTPIAGFIVSCFFFT